MTPFYRFAHAFCKLVFILLWRFKANGAENVPATGPVIVACNHLSYLDPVAVGIGLPRMVTYLAKKELFDMPVLGFFVRGCGAYPLDREAGGVAAVRAALRVLKDGRCIGIFPEGTRNLTGTAGEKGGAAFLAALSGAPVVPAAVSGTKDAKRLARIRVVYGKPMLVTRNRKADSDDLEKWTAEIMRNIRVLEESIGGN
ncbi:MAG: lysophospholipid acyltransferase family protein [Candidatus Velthaea sp.]|jgi:1-acyl-sn-glycerol-3-phosphate acyltransferase